MPLKNKKGELWSVRIGGEARVNIPAEHKGEGRELKTGIFLGNRLYCARVREARSETVV